MARLDMPAVARIVREVAAEEIMPRWRNLAEGDVTSKGRDGPVTVADHAAEAALTRRLGALLPGSIVVGEEAFAADPGILGRFREAGPVWVIDPIDGTRKFAAGDPTFDVMVALVVGGEPVAGWIFAPVDDIMHMGEAGAGACIERLDGTRPIVAAEGLALSAMEGQMNAGGFAQRGFADPAMHRHHFRSLVRLQCGGHNYGRLFQGLSHFLVNFSTYPWDHLPGLAIAKAAGFAAARHDGRPFDPLDRTGGVLVTPDRASWTRIREIGRAHV